MGTDTDSGQTIKDVDTESRETITDEDTDSGETIIDVDRGWKGSQPERGRGK